MSRTAAAALITAAVLIGGCGDGGEGAQDTTIGTGDAVVAEVEGVDVVEDLTNAHVEGEVDYDHVPPVGGDHSQVWLNCGVYDVPVPDENAVHSLEHGVVWLAHDPDLADTEVEALHELHAEQPDRMIVSPYPDVEAPVVAVAWGRRLEVDSATDPRLADFVDAYVNGPDAPEPGASCEGGLGLAD